jgi:tetratricopeptide (TPR) repeat protein
MKKQIFTLFIMAMSFGMNAQIVAPKASPLTKGEYKVGLTDVKIEYSRPGKKDRKVFGDVVPMNEVWRMGANENTKITTSDVLVFGKDTLKAGTYALFAKPMEKSWEVYFYTDITNWGTPDQWDDKKVALKLNAEVVNLKDVVETFTISIDNYTNSSANLVFSWDLTKVSIPFKVNTDVKMMANIDKVMNGPSANDYYAAADYYYKEKKDLKKALEWASKAVELRGESAYWFLKLKAVLQFETKDVKGAIETIKKAIASAEKEGNPGYAEGYKKLLSDWEKK